MNFQLFVPIGRKIALTLVVLLGVLVLLAGAASGVAVQRWQSNDLDGAVGWGKVAAPGVEVLSVVSLRRVPVVEVWKNSLRLLKQWPELQEQLAEVLPANEPEVVLDLAAAARLLNQVEPDLQPLLTNLDRAVILRPLLKNHDFKAYQQKLTAVTALLNYLSQNSQAWVVVLQNSDELRATGGFPGSYALVTMENGRITNLVVEDIYDADGQFTGYIEPPPGVREYLAGNKGLRLPDANWQADFRESGQQMLDFFEIAGKKHLGGMVALNLPLVEDLLAMTGPVRVLDYDTNLTPESLSTALRSGRDTFFPGSAQKKHLLELAWLQFQLALTQLPNEKKLEAGQILLNGINTKQLLAYSPNEALQPAIEALGASGRLNNYQAEEYFYLLESNVGINKANVGITRNYDLVWQPAAMQLNINFTNHNQPKTQQEIFLIEASSSIQEAPHNGYVNYQRVLLPAAWEVEKVEYQDQAITNFDTTFITTPENTKLKQIGFLLTLPENSSGQLKIHLKKPAATSNSPTQLAIQKQPGIRTIPVKITTPNQEIEFNLETDTLLQMPDLVLQ